MEDIFVSLAFSDRETAARLVEQLEGAGDVCWLAPRDVRPGEDYAEAIVSALREPDAVVLLGSAAAYGSQHVVR